MTFDHLNRQRDAIRMETDAQEKQKKASSASAGIMHTDTAKGYLELFDYISLLQKEIDLQDKEIENQYYRNAANEQKLQNQRREEEYQKRESLVAGRIQAEADAAALRQIPGNTLAGAIHAETEAAVRPVSGPSVAAEPVMTPASVQHQKLASAVTASEGPQRPVMRASTATASPGRATYVPNNSRPVPDNGWQRANRNPQPAVSGGYAGNVPQNAPQNVPQNVPQPEAFRNAVPVQGVPQQGGYPPPPVPEYYGGNVGQSGNDYAGEQHFDDVPMPECDDFASDSDDESDKANSVVYTQMDLSTAVQNNLGSTGNGNEKQGVHHRRRINGREIRMPMDLLGEVQDSFTRDLVSAGVSMENLVILNNGVREFGSSENEWIIRLPRAMDGILDKKAPVEIGNEISSGLGRDIKVKFDFVDQDVIEGCPDELDKECYERALDEEFRSITENPDFRKFSEMLGIDSEHAVIELVQPKTKGLS